MSPILGSSAMFWRPEPKFLEIWGPASGKTPVEGRDSAARLRFGLVRRGAGR